MVTHTFIGVGCINLIFISGMGLRMRELVSMFLTFCKIGALMFGGGYTVLPMLQKEVVENHGWAEPEEIVDYYAVSQCLPGIISVNTATLVGYKNKGVIGSICCTVGVVFPSLVVIMAIAAFIKSFAHIPLVQHAFAGIRVAVCALIMQTVYKLFKSSVKDKAGFVLFLLALLAIAVFNFSPVYLVVAAALFGVLRGKVASR